MPPPAPPNCNVDGGDARANKNIVSNIEIGGGAAAGVGAVKRLQGNLKLSISDGGKGFHATFDSVTRKTKRCTNKHSNK